ncbi:putative colanic acid biosynthesis acetyltransferase [Neolewinella antarctica]|uniref:Colanic acid biosynthesis acetyltransferase WcaF n=1 Tax=Neolewinella antarctica TaxID=442734 RepID=A0ABX0XBR3_9BACT|nr:putative colanic acid biosynthesis acetyltransferase [Neolewinella antarctica]NJC26647.1 putative colanic acid biosynthesis acetyltransferase WcaF [Neolewinella antarctica]
MPKLRYQDLSTFTMPAGFRGRSAVTVQLWWIVQTLLFSTSPQFMYAWRRWLLRLFGATIGEGVILRPTMRVQFPWKVSIGDYAWIGDDVVLYSLGPITIGEHAVISQKSYLCTGSHLATDRSFTIYAEPILIEPEAWIATDVYVGPGVTIGRGSVVGARSSVFKDLPAGKICVGSPAKVIRDRLPGDSLADQEGQIVQS